MSGPARSTARTATASSSSCAQLGETNKEIGETIGVSRETVRQAVQTSVREVLWSEHDLPTVVTGADGKRYPTKKASKPGTLPRKAEGPG